MSVCLPPPPGSLSFCLFLSSVQINLLTDWVVKGGGGGGERGAWWTIQPRCSSSLFFCGRPLWGHSGMGRDVCTFLSHAKYWTWLFRFLCSLFFPPLRQCPAVLQDWIKLTERAAVLRDPFPCLRLRWGQPTYRHLVSSQWGLGGGGGGEGTVDAEMNVPFAQ